MLEKSRYICQEIQLLSTTFKRWDGIVVNYPNSTLSTMAICNVRRTGSQWARIEIEVSFSTSTSVLSLIDRRVQEYIQSEIESRDIARISQSSFELRPVTNSLLLVLRVQLKFSFQDLPRKNRALNDFHHFLISNLHDLGIGYVPTTLRISRDTQPLDIS